MEERKLNINRRAWNLKDKPERIQSHAKTYDGRKRSHKPAKAFPELTKGNRKNFKEIADRIRESFPGIPVYAWGSRVEGIFKKDSDYDVILNCDQATGQKIVKEVQFEQRVDIYFNMVGIGLLIP